MVRTEERDVLNQHHKEDFDRRFPGKSVPQIICDGQVIGVSILEKIENLF